MSSSSPPFIAHVRSSDGSIQTLNEHLRETAELCSLFSLSIGLPLCGKLLGLLHDLGKYSASFQEYIRKVTGLMGEEAQATAEATPETIDHSTAGARHLWNHLGSKGKAARLMGQILSVVVMSHHSRTGMKDFISLDGKSAFLHRNAREEEKTHLSESLNTAESDILRKINDLLNSACLMAEFKTVASKIKATTNGQTTRHVSFSLLTRFLFSCLLDADRLSTANFEKPHRAGIRTTGQIPDWHALCGKLDRHLATLPEEPTINRIRRRISNDCYTSANRLERLLTLSIPTGGGKTFASLRFALHRAAQSTPLPLERIIYVIPYTSIIDQNAAAVREILGDNAVLEHHSNLTPEKDNWQTRVLSENWDAPIVFTTSVQFLDSLFAAGTRTARRMHQLANSILIFDEVQALPLKTFHAFNNAINFLTEHANTTVLLCTATMPLLHRVDPRKGSLPISPECEIVRNKEALFSQLKRTEIYDKTRDLPWCHTEIANFALECTRLHQSALVICNTKDSARRLFDLLRSSTDAPKVVHLSTSMCPAHRRGIIVELEKKLHPDTAQPVICVSTQLIEAGVDLDFGCVIRSLAGLDSIIQAAGRCNRHGLRSHGHVYILNFAEEQLGKALREISEAQQDTLRILGEFRNNPESLGNSLLSEKAVERFYYYHYFKRSAEMVYPLKAGKEKPPIAADTSLLDLLGENPAALEAAKREGAHQALNLPLKQAFSTAAQAFQVIDAPTRGIIVPYKTGSEIIGHLSAALANDAYPLPEKVRLLKLAQQFTVNVFPHVLDELRKQEAIREFEPATGIFHLDERHYHPDHGVTLEALSELHYLEAS